MSGASVDQISLSSPSAQAGSNAQIEAISHALRVQAEGPGWELVPGVHVRPVPGGDVGAAGYRFELSLSWDMAEKIGTFLRPFLPLAEAVNFQRERQAREVQRAALKRHKHNLWNAAKRCNRLIRRKPEGVTTVSILEAVSQAYGQPVRTLEYGMVVYRRRLRQFIRQRRDARIRALFLAGRTPVEIGRVVGVTAATVKRVVEKRGRP